MTSERTTDMPFVVSELLRGGDIAAAELTFEVHSARTERCGTGSSTEVARGLGAAHARGSCIAT